MDNPQRSYLSHLAAGFTNTTTCLCLVKPLALLLSSCGPCFYVVSCSLRLLPLCRKSIHRAVLVSWSPDRDRYLIDERKESGERESKTKKRILVTLTYQILYILNLATLYAVCGC